MRPGDRVACAGDDRRYGSTRLAERYGTVLAVDTTVSGTRVLVRLDAVTVRLAGGAEISLVATRQWYLADRLRVSVLETIAQAAQDGSDHGEEDHQADHCRDEEVFDYEDGHAEEDEEERFLR